MRGPTISRPRASSRAVSSRARAAAACPTGGNNCYGVTIAQSVPLFLAPVIGYMGTVVMDGQPMQALAATAVASRTNQYCVLALGGSGAEGIHTNGAPKADLSGCDIMSNTSATCNGHNLNADIGNAHGTNSGCGVIQNSNASIVSDQYALRASQIPANNCKSYPQEPSKKAPPLPASTLWSGNYPQS